ncbi:MAG: hypothetical protein ABIH23_05360, partial [bacterium]
SVNFAPLITRLHEAIEFGETLIHPIRFNADGAKAWEKVYPALSEEKPGLFGVLTARAEAQVIRLASIYALLDCSSVIAVDDLKAALALWEYSEASVRHVFGDSTGDAIADRILEELRQCAGMSRSQILRELFNRNRSSAQIAQALGLLERAGLARMEIEETDGRSREIWRAVRHTTLTT